MMRVYYKVVHLSYQQKMVLVSKARTFLHSLILQQANETNFFLTLKFSAWSDASSCTVANDVEPVFVQLVVVTVSKATS